MSSRSVSCSLKRWTSAGGKRVRSAWSGASGCCARPHAACSTDSSSATRCADTMSIVRAGRCGDSANARRYVRGSCVSQPSGAKPYLVVAAKRRTSTVVSQRPPFGIHVLLLEHQRQSRCVVIFQQACRIPHFCRIVFLVEVRKLLLSVRLPARPLHGMHLRGGKTACQRRLELRAWYPCFSTSVPRGG
jgi:hypothetical protein